MNKTRIKQLVEHLEQIPDELFSYTKWFAMPGIDEESANKVIRQEAFNYAFKHKEPPCGTTACVAGHTCLIFWDNCTNKLSDKFHGFESIAQELLGLDAETASQLFRKNTHIATKEDAIKRLKYILKWGVIDEHYQWEKESYNKHISRIEAVTKYGAEVVEKATDMYETDFGKVFFIEDCKQDYDCPLAYLSQIEYLDRAKIICENERKLTFNTDADIPNEYHVVTEKILIMSAINLPLNHGECLYDKLLKMARAKLELHDSQYQHSIRIEGNQFVVSFTKQS